MSETEDQPSRLPLRRVLPSRKRLTELTVVVFGVLIALGLENLVQEWRWKLEGRELEALARQELELNLAQAIERIAVDPCLRDRVALLASGLRGEATSYAPQPAARGTNSSVNRALAQAYEPVLRPWRSASMERLMGAEASKRVAPERLLAQSAVLTTLDSIRRDQMEEVAASGRLLPLAVGVPRLDAEVRAGLLADLGDLDRARAGVELVSRRLVDRGTELGVAPDMRDVQSRLEELRAVSGDCVDVQGGLAIARQLAESAN
ncbi:MAG: hypothetical protein K2X61_01005 [Caulobacteraceae bacterium]|nr:hypothetical protein [Caulobacteraceae bacterium]